MNDGDFIKIEYEMRAGDDKKLVMTSSEQLAKDNDIFDENRKYGPATIIVGSDQVFEKINESFKNAEKDKEYEVDLSAEDAYGARDTKNIRIHTYREFKKQNIDPAPGMEVHLNNRHGKVLSVTPGRVLVDYNAPLAGKTLQYKYTVKDVLEGDQAKTLALVTMNYPIDESKLQVSADGKVMTVEVPEEAKFDPVWIEAKFRFVNDVRKYLPGVTLVVAEKYEPMPEPETPAEEAKTEEKQTEEKPAEKPSEEPSKEEEPQVQESEKAEPEPAKPEESGTEEGKTEA